MRYVKPSIPLTAVTFALLCVVISLAWSIAARTMATSHSIVPLAVYGAIATCGIALVSKMLVDLSRNITRQGKWLGGQVWFSKMFMRAAALTGILIGCLVILPGCASMKSYDETHDNVCLAGCAAAQAPVCKEQASAAKDPALALIGCIGEGIKTCSKACYVAPTTYSILPSQPSATVPSSPPAIEPGAAAEPVKPPEENASAPVQ